MVVKVTVNNTMDIPAIRHAYGTVVIPIRMANVIVNRRFLIDCTYRQFFTIQSNIIANYLDSHLSMAIFINQDKDQIQFTKELLKKMIC